VKTLADRKHFSLAALAAVAFALAAPSQAVAAGSHGFAGHDRGGAVGHDGSAGHHLDGRHFEGHGFEGNHFDGRHFEGHDSERRHFEGRGGFGFIAPYYAPYYVAPNYWYYCRAYDAYYPDVSSCPEAWVPVPAS
jgi:hypothetical protein